ncbi:MAG: zinc-binding dehydrogenase, partial [Planctomycetota bacterium]
VGDSVAIVGLGGVGLSALMAAVAAGASSVIAIDINESKLETSKEFGACHAFNATDPEIVSKVKEATAGGVDIAVESAGVPKALELAFEVTRVGGSTVAAGLPNPTRTVSISHFLLGAQERVLRGSYMGSCIASRDIPKFLNMYRQGNLAVDKLASETIGFDDLNEAFDLMGTSATLRNILIPR